MSDITVSLGRVQERDPHAAGELVPLIYEELRRMANEDTGHTLQPPAIAPEAWLRLVGNENQKWDGRAHFRAAPARDEELLAISEAVDQFAARDKPKAEFVRLQYFFGLTLGEAAAADRPCQSLSHPPKPPARPVRERPQATDSVKLMRFPRGKTTLRRPPAFMTSLLALRSSKKPHPAKPRVTKPSDNL